jgi:hypothetical protein
MGPVTQRRSIAAPGGLEIPRRLIACRSGVLGRRGPGRTTAKRVSVRLDAVDAHRPAHFLEEILVVELILAGIDLFPADIDIGIAAY